MPQIRMKYLSKTHAFITDSRSISRFLYINSRTLNNQQCFRTLHREKMPGIQPITSHTLSCHSDHQGGDRDKVTELY